MTIYLAEWRRFRRMTQEKLAELAGTDKTQISRLERGERQMTVKWLSRLAPCLGCEEHDLLSPPTSDDFNGRLTKKVDHVTTPTQPKGKRPMSTRVRLAAKMLAKLSEDERLEALDWAEDFAPQEGEIPQKGRKTS